MTNSKKQLRTCGQGHRYYKSSDCPNCPICEKEKTAAGDLPKLPAPARRAIENVGVGSLLQLSKYSENEILGLHGMGPKAIKILRGALTAAGLDFSEK